LQIEFRPGESPAWFFFHPYFYRVSHVLFDKNDQIISNREIYDISPRHLCRLRHRILSLPEEAKKRSGKWRQDVRFFPHAEFRLQQEEKRLKQLELHCHRDRFGGITCSELFHDIHPVRFNGTGTDRKIARNLL
jgi:hypothetical protein